MKITKLFYYLLTHYNCLFKKNNISEIKVENNCFRYFKHRYYRLINSFCYKEYYDDYEKKIWMCWLQGIDEAPELVKRCIKSVIKNKPKDYEIVFIDRKNYSDYIDLPEYIIKKWEKGIIGNAHFSDLIRLQLLIKFGGVWIDSTCLLNKNIPDLLLDANLFFFSNYKRKSKITMSNWFLVSKKNNPILINTYNILLEHWKKHSYCVSYFLFHIIFSLVIQKNNINFDDYIFISNIIPHSLDYIINFDNEKNIDIYYDFFIFKLNLKHNYLSESCIYNRFLKKEE